MGVAQPAALQMSASEAPRASAQDDATPLVGEHAAWAGRAHLVLHKPRWWHPLSSGPSSAWRQHSPSAALRNKQRAVLRSWSSESIHVLSQCTYRTERSQGWVCLLQGQRLQVHHLVPEGSGRNLGHIARPGSQCCTGVSRPKLKARFVDRKCLQVPHPLDRGQRSQE